MVGGLSWGYVGPSWGYVGPSWGYVGPSWGDVGPSWSYVGPSWGYVGPSWGYVGPCWGLCWPILRPMLAHVDPFGATKAEKVEKMGRARNTVKRGTFWRHVVGGSGSAAGAAAPLSYGEERNAVRLCHGQGAPGRIRGYAPLPPTPGLGASSREQRFSAYFHSDPAMSEADQHVLSGALAFGGTETLGAGAFRGSADQLRRSQGWKGRRRTTAAAPPPPPTTTSSLGRGDTFKASLVPNVAFWNQKKISRKAPGRWPKDMLLGRQGRRGRV